MSPDNKNKRHEVEKGTKMKNGFPRPFVRQRFCTLIDRNGLASSIAMGVA